VQATAWDQLNHATEYRFDRFGGPTAVTTTVTDAITQETTAQVTTYHRDDNGLITEMDQPDLGGYDGVPITKYFYDARGNLTEEDLPDGSQELWT
jgi:hypothetical protein